MPLDIRLNRLHQTLQAAVGWTNSHLYMFEAEGATWGVPDPDADCFKRNTHLETC